MSRYVLNRKTGYLQQVPDKPKSEPPVRSSELLAAARAMCEKMDEVNSHPLYLAVWTCAWNHGIDYSNGPSYKSELTRLKNAVKAAND